MFLIRSNKKTGSAHFWNGHDTACKMWSTGGMNQRRKWSVLADAGSRPICTMCANVQRRDVKAPARRVELAHAA